MSGPSRREEQDRRPRQPAAQESITLCFNWRSVPAGLSNHFNVAAMPYGKRHLPAVVNPSGPNASGGAGANEIVVYPGQMPPSDAAFIVGSYYVPGVGMVEVWARRPAVFPWEQPGMEPPPE